MKIIEMKKLILILLFNYVLMFQKIKKLGFDWNDWIKLKNNFYKKWIIKSLFTKIKIFFLN